jgi:2-dehydro-3-deoxygluconokinase
VIGDATRRPPSLVAFGELLLRLDAPVGDRLVQAGSFEARYTGSEANVAASLVGFGLAAEVVSVVPDDALGEACLSYLRRFGVGVGQVVRRPGRLGLLFHEHGGVGRAPVVVYDRAGSVFATAEPDGYDWRTLLAGRSWLHISGTAPALGPGVRTAVGQAMRAARELGLGVSLDLNYRPTLWSLADAGPVLAELLPHADIMLGSGRDAAALFGLDLPGDDDPGALAGQIRLAGRLRERFGLRAVAGTARLPGTGGSRRLHGLLVDGQGSYVSEGYPVLDAVGRIGTGDAFAAGLLHGILSGSPSAQTVRFAAAAAHLKQSIRGDVNLVTVAEVNALLAGAPADRVVR